MVAARPYPPADTEPPRTTRGAHGREYSRAIDPREAAVESGGGDHRLVPVTQHEAFRPRRSLTKAERVELQIKQAALRIAAGLETRSFRTLAAEIGCCHQAIDGALARMCDRLGLRKFLRSDATRARQRDARLAFLRRKGETGKICPPPR